MVVELLQSLSNGHQIIPFYPEQLRAVRFMEAKKDDGVPNYTILPLKS